jgi:hypothetical protein
MNKKGKSSIEDSPLRTSKYQDSITCIYCSKSLATVKNKKKHESTCKKRPIESNNNLSNETDSESDEPNVENFDNEIIDKKPKKKNNKNKKEKEINDEKTRKKNKKEKETVDNDDKIINVNKPNEGTVNDYLTLTKNEGNISVFNPKQTNIPYKLDISNVRDNETLRLSFTIIEKILIWIGIPYLLFSNFSYV